MERLTSIRLSRCMLGCVELRFPLRAFAVLFSFLPPFFSAFLIIFQPLVIFCSLVPPMLVPPARPSRPTTPNTNARYLILRLACVECVVCLSIRSPFLLSPHPDFGRRPLGL